MRVAIDGSALDPDFKSHAHRGIGRYVDRLRDALNRSNTSSIALSWFNHNQLLTKGIAPKVIDLLPFGRTTVRQQALYPFRLARGELKEVDFVHFPAHMDGPAWSTKPYVLTLLDLIPVILGDLYKANRPNWRYHFARWLESTSIRNASFILTISETTARDAERLLGLPRERIAVTPCGVDECFINAFQNRIPTNVEDRIPVRKRLGLPENRPILLYVGGHDERKNTDKIVEIAREVISHSGSVGRPLPVLVFAGKIGEGIERERLRTALRNFAMAADTFILGFVQDHDLLDLYAESSVFLFPSLYEGFGLPPLEALATGLPVVSSNAGALREVLGDAALFMEPNDVIRGAKLTLDILSDQDMATSLSLNGHEHAKQFSWDRTAQATLRAYEQVGAILLNKQEPLRLSGLMKDRSLGSARPVSECLEQRRP